MEITRRQTLSVIGSGIATMGFQRAAESINGRIIEEWEDFHKFRDMEKKHMDKKTLENYVNSNINHILNDKMFPVIRERPVSKEKSSEEMKSCASLVESIMKDGGIQNTKILVSGNSYPAVYGEIRSPVLDAPTILIQGHYDSQPSDEKGWDKINPETKTKIKPHEPVVIKENEERRVYGRGTSDDWGQVLAHLTAVESYVKSGATLPVNIKFLIEGGEEEGSKDMNKLLEQYKDLLSADVVMITDSAPGRKDHPVITTITRGIVAADVSLKLGTNNSHSGINLAPNALGLMSAITSSFKDYETGRVLIPSFYDDVIMPSEEERAKINQMPFDVEAYKINYGLEDIVVEEGYSVQETMWLRPSYELHELPGGGRTNNIPAEASAYITMRIVKNQDPNKIYKLFEKAFFDKAKKFHIMPHQLEIKNVSSSFYFSTTTNSPYFKAAEEAMKEAFGFTVDYMGCGGTEPIALFYQQTLKVPIIFNAYNSPMDNYHGNNESFSIERGFIPGVIASMLFYENVGKLGRL